MLASNSNGRPLVVAHRGASADAPENTLPAFQLAWEQEADAIEGDFHLTRDDEIVCIHDKNTARYGGPERTVRKTRLADLQRVDAGSWRGAEWEGVAIPTLAEVFTILPSDKKLYIEIKSSPKIVSHLLTQIDQSEVDPQQLLIISFNSRVIEKIKVARPSLKACWLADIRQSRLTRSLQPSAQTLLAQLAKNQADGLSVYGHPDLEKSFVDTIKSAGYELHVWTVDEPEDARRWRDYGANSITTNKPALIKSVL